MSGPIIIIMTFEFDIIEFLVLIFDNLMRLKKGAPGPGSLNSNQYLQSSQPEFVRLRVDFFSLRWTIVQPLFM